MDFASVHDVPPSFDRASTDLKSLTPSFDCTMNVQTTSPSHVTAQREPAAMAVDELG
jgi:hypothetical protein